MTFPTTYPPLYIVLPRSPKHKRVYKKQNVLQSSLTALSLPQQVLFFPYKPRGNYVRVYYTSGSAGPLAKAFGLGQEPLRVDVEVENL